MTGSYCRYEGLYEIGRDEVSGHDKTRSTLIRKSDARAWVKICTSPCPYPRPHLTLLTMIMQPVATTPHRRASISVAHPRSPTGRDSPFILQSGLPGPAAEKWVGSWAHVHARSRSLSVSPSNTLLTADTALIDSRIVAVDADCTVEDACDASLTLILRYPGSCILVAAPQGRYFLSSSQGPT